MKTALLVSDIDGTLLGDAAALRRCNAWLEARRDRIAIAYASGRTRPSILQSVAADGLLEPDAVICNVGTEIYAPPEGDALHGWRDSISRAWSAQEVRKALANYPGLEAQPDDAQSDLKVSYFLHDAAPEQIEDIRSRVVDAGIHGQIVYSSGRDLDVLPAGADKGAAAGYLALHWNIPFAHVIVAGDSGNDLALFGEGFCGIIVANAQPELKSHQGATVFHASAECAGGVLEGLEHWWSTIERAAAPAGRSN